MKRAHARLRPKAKAKRYDEYVGRFIDIVQGGETGFQQLYAEWYESCPLEWRLRFSEDAVEIELLIQSGAFLAVIEA